LEVRVLPGPPHNEINDLEDISATLAAVISGSYSEVSADRAPCSISRSRVAPADGARTDLLACESKTARGVPGLGKVDALLNSLHRRELIMGIFRLFFLGGISAAAIIAVYTYISWRMNWAALKHPGDARLRRLDWVRNDTIGGIYRETLLGTVLGYTGSKIGDLELASSETSRSRFRRLFVAPLSVASFEFCIRCAFIYPIVSAFLFWVAGASNSIGGYPLFPPPEVMGFSYRLLFLTVAIFSTVIVGFVLREMVKLGGEQARLKFDSVSENEAAALKKELRNADESDSLDSY
jgi:hypothetical protein